MLHSIFACHRTAREHRLPLWFFRLLERALARQADIADDSKSMLC